ncbi:uncharacterized protein TNIN_36351 [Trichonephila inaurata madagascariensis]|uniref:Uncharacterized protein n=1 Tax=Trichonephila inaurata madagascariensis TaxID=2747483 RepID=A0A8X6Y6J2_9ARAC|nr:uncharacterized protein TNIN_36351 [Trichonephila inaurata madagascariensis]
MFSNLFGKNSSVIGSDVEVSPIKETVTLVDIDEGFEEIDLAEIDEDFEEIDLAEIDEEEFFECAATQEELNSLLESESQGKTISYALKPLLYTAKYGAKALSATTVVVSYALNGASYGIAGVSYIPHGASKVLEKCKGEDKNTAGYKITTSSQNLLDFTSGAIYTASYVPYGAGKVLYKASDMTDWVDSYLSPEKIEQVCTKSDLLVDNLSSKLKGTKIENFSQALAVAC